MACSTPAERQWESAAFREALHNLGYVEGSNILIDVRSAEGKLERMPELAAALINSDVDVIVSVNTPSTRAAMEATKTIPIVMTAIGDPVGLGLVPSLARPRGNVPFTEMETAAKALGLKLQSLPVRGPDDFERAFEAAKKEGVHAFVTSPTPAINAQRDRIVDFAAKNRLPAIYAAPEFVDAGGLMYYGPSYLDLFRRAATYVDKILKSAKPKILKGAKPADLPVEQPTKFELLINLKVAKQIGLTIPPNVLARADKVIR